MLKRRMILPTVVIRGSREDLKTGPSISFSASSSKRNLLGVVDHGSELVHHEQPAI